MVFGLTDWAEYDVDVEEADSFRLSLRYAHPFAAAARVRVSVNGVNGAPITGSVALAPTCGWGSDGSCWGIATASNVPMSAGTHVLRLVMNTGLHNVDYIEPSP